MPTILEQVKQAEREREHKARAAAYKAALERAATLDSYRDLLARAAEPGEGDAASLKGLMGTLGLTLADVEADVKALRKVAALEARLAPEAVAERERAAADADARAAEASGAATQALLDAGWALVNAVSDQWRMQYLTNLAQYARATFHHVHGFRGAESAITALQRAESAASSAQYAAERAHSAIG